MIEKCGKKFQSRRNLSQHVNKEHKITGNRSVIVNPGDGPVQDQSELDLIALLTVVAEEDLKLAAANESHTVINTGINNQLITVDASAITPVKNNDESKSPVKKQVTVVCLKHSVITYGSTYINMDYVHIHLCLM